ncbi:uncharacterized protein LOC122667442 isoform X2 [Telopea speciosissima]|uniref:uncharacterized protein LOC122667442 isoform X2 n=1 Tax=Telopea speciosissima TaxID=54955 RepID=UPI001CC53C58|nr:uncharacterized protein LOC122667442 isoform X2 [Telopea speciosissima]
MGRGGKLIPRRSGKRRSRSKEEGSDDSDEDYILGQDEGKDTSESSDYVSSFAEEDSEEAFDFETVSGGSQEDEEEKMVLGLKSRSVLRDQRKPSFKRSQKRTRISDDDEVDYGYDDEEFLPDGIDLVDGRGRRAVRLNPDKSSSDCIKRSRKRTRASVDYDDNEDDENDDDDDEEFTLDGIDIVDDDEDFQVREKINSRKRVVRKRVSLKGQKRKRKSKAANKPLRKKGRRTKRKSSVSWRQVNNSDDDFIANNRTVKEKTKKKSRRRKKRSAVSYSDSDVVSSGSSDYEYTISEEEREVLREASIFCGNLTICLRSSSLSEQFHVDETSNHQQKKIIPGRKGKVKVEELRIDVGKQVCGICLSEEGKGTIRGTLNCCNHYFCFACILEWSKVESRCPLCKQRFSTISKPANSILGIDLRSVIVRVAKRDQVYRPTEEEIRGYFDPYENVVCMECQQAGDDNLMLLCDICDSPAHTYCVGLGREVPEGNWYCEGCRAADPGSSNSLVQDPVFNQMTVTSNLSAGLSTGEVHVESSNETCQNSVSVQGPSVSPGIGVVPSPRHALGGDFQATSPVTGAGASTLWGRRRIRHRIHSLLSSNRMNEGAEMASRNDGALRSVFGNSELELGGETDQTTHQNALISESARSRFAVGGCMEEDSNRCPVQEEDAFDASFRHLSRHINEGPNTATLSGSAGGTLCAEDAEISAASGLWQLHQCTDASISHNTYRDEAHFHMAKAAEEQKGAKQQLQPIVRHHLKRLSQHTQVDRGTFKDIARHSTHTILAACGLDHDRSMAILVQPPSICPHVERQSEPINQMENCCSSCFNSFVGDVVRRVLNSRLQSLAFNR